MKKLLCIICLLLGIMLMFASCAPKPDGTDKEQTSTGDDVVNDNQDSIEDENPENNEPSKDDEKPDDENNDDPLEGETEEHVHTPSEEIIENQVPANCYENGCYDVVVYCTDENCPVGELSRVTNIIYSTGHEVPAFDKYNPTANGWEQISNESLACLCEAKPAYTNCCIVCGQSMVQYGISQGHSYVVDAANSYIIIDPTAETNGLIFIGTCENCSCHNYELEIPAFNSKDYTEYIYESTCTMPGYAIYNYKHSSISYSWTIELPLSDHIYSDMFCTMCGEMAPAGLYDEKSNLVASWDELVNIYDMDVEQDYTIENCKSHPSQATSVLKNDNLSSGKKLIIGNDITHIGEYAFYYCTSLTEVIIPSGVTSINSFAFSCCESLASLTIPNTVTEIGHGTFMNCTSLTSLVLPGSVRSVGNSGFAGCTLLTSLVICDGVISIGPYAFEGCTSLTSVTFPESVREIVYFSFYNCTSLASVTIPKSVTLIDNSALNDCTALANIYYTGTQTEWDAITIAEGNEVIHNATVYFFSGTTPQANGNFWRYINGAITIWSNTSVPTYSEGLKYANIDSKTCYVSGIGSCTDTDIVIPEVTPDGHMVVGIGHNAFIGCSSIASIYIPDSVTSIGEFAFYGCTALEYIRLPSELSEIKENTFYGCASIKTIDLPVKVETIAKYAFYDCRALESIYLPSKITSIGESAFANCKSLKRVSISEGVTTIAARTFHNCKALTDIVIPYTVTKIGERAFFNCGLIKYVSFTGNERQWNKIVLEEGNTDLTNANISFYITDEE